MRSVDRSTRVLDRVGKRMRCACEVATYQLTEEHRTGTSAYRDTYSYLCSCQPA